MLRMWLGLEIVVAGLPPLVEHSNIFMDTNKHPNSKQAPTQTIEIYLKININFNIIFYLQCV